MSVLTLVACVLIAAVNFALLRDPPENDRIWLRLAALPIVNTLAIAHYRSRGGDRSPFLLGFQVFGWAALLMYLGLCSVRQLDMSMALARASEWVQVTTLDNLDFDTMKRRDPTFGLAMRISKRAQFAFASAVVTAMLLPVAVCGGLIMRWRRRAAGDAGATA
jgi:hypothetical protein